MPVYFTRVNEHLTTRISELMLESILISSGVKNVDHKSHSKRDKDAISASLILEIFLQELERE